MNSWTAAFVFRSIFLGFPTTASDEVSERANPTIVASQFAYPFGSILQTAGISAIEGPRGRTVAALSSPTRLTRLVLPSPEVSTIPGAPPVRLGGFGTCL